MDLNIKCFFPSNVGFFSILLSDNLLLNLSRLVRIFNTIEYMKMTSISPHLRA